jgi:isocitrate dehydrogenase kinase/phosphatase
MIDLARVADPAAAIIAEGFARHVRRFREMTRGAAARFAARDWAALHDASTRRLDLYGEQLTATLDALLPLLGGRLHDREAWSALRAQYAGRIAGEPAAELAETYFNSVTRRLFATIGVDPAIEFVRREAAPPVPEEPSGATLVLPCRSGIAALASDIFAALLPGFAFEDAARDARRVAEASEQLLGGRRLRAVELAPSAFFRGQRAFVVGRALLDQDAAPFLLAFANPAGRLVADAALFDENEISIVFSFARAYFLVDAERPRELVGFLRTLMPRKPVNELYNAIGWDKHGKTELYRSLLRHLESSDDRFVTAPGQRGMVMHVFTLPGFDVVFKVIRDHFDPPKTASRREVEEKYRHVFRHDRAGRLVDAAEFEHLEFERSRFAPDLLEDLLRLAPSTVSVQGDHVVFRHLYTERRLLPLDLHLRQADPVTARAAVLDYGKTLRDLAAANVFPGDMLLKNFGVSRHGRLIFYDYDELCPLTDCNFRALPQPANEEEEMAVEPWFSVDDRDVFPEEFAPFLGLKGELLRLFLDEHGELLRPGFWQVMQARIRAGEVLEILPYPEARRLAGS